MAIKGAKAKVDEVKCEVLEKCGIVGDRGKSKLELRYVAWNGKEPRYDLRPWYIDEENGNVERCLKGLTLSGEELINLGKIIAELAEEED